GTGAVAVILAVLALPLLAALGRGLRGPSGLLIAFLLIGAAALAGKLLGIAAARLRLPVPVTALPPQLSGRRATPVRRGERGCAELRPAALRRPAACPGAWPDSGVESCSSRRIESST